MKHYSVMLSESIEGLNIKEDGIYVDATLGYGGHSSEILKRIPNGFLYSFDQDAEAIKSSTERLDKIASNYEIIYSNFVNMKKELNARNIEHVDGILFDLGVSSPQLDEGERGFSFHQDAILDMRMNQKAKQTAAWILANYNEEQLANIFYLYGELKSARKIASAIVKARNISPIDTIERLLEVTKPLINPRQEKKELAMLFQALRIEVNGEINVLKKFLQQSLNALKPGGRLVIITYHSLEDRLVKNFMRSGNLTGEMEKDFFGRNLSPFKLLTSKPIVPSDEEIERNPRSRSAKLRIAQKLQP